MGLPSLSIPQVYYRTNQLFAFIELALIELALIGLALIGLALIELTLI